MREIEFCVPCNGRVGLYPDRKDYHVRFNRTAIRKLYLKNGTPAHEGGNPVFQLEGYAFFAQVLLDHGREIIIDDVHDLFERFDDGDLKAALLQVFGHFEPDKTASDNHRAPGFGRVYLFLDGVDIRDRPERHDGRIVNTRNGRTNRHGAGTQYEGVVGFVEFCV
ncbi:MAG: hypothetical protein BWY20_02480 [Spirochaetes bacterium ADurb.Bin215]|nr:MAG: hypothetical protein BWY20_02480 [Spirochaetes bacterium ADurb.Bin215]